MAILGTLWKDRLYGLEILRLLEDNASLGLAEGTLYVILHRLRTDGLVESEWVDAGRGHPRKYYWLAPAGRQRLRDMARFWVRFAADLETLLEPALGRKELAHARR
jgi:PadR family transcriptional regulator PadR